MSGSQPTSAPESDGRPDPDRIGGRVEFAAALTAVRERAGLTVRQVAAKAGAYSAHSTIGDWFAGRGLPALSSQDLLVRVLTVCGVRPTMMDGWIAAWLRVRRGPGPRPRHLEPYKGLATFQPQDAGWFFGREQLTAELVEQVTRLHAAGGGLFLVVGASGSGKSSLLRAGLIARLRSAPRRATAPVPTDEPAPEDPSGPDNGWSVELMTPGADPTAELATRAQRLRAAPGPRLLVIDQAEELFISGPDHADPAAFLADLNMLCERTTGLVVVFGLRADFYGHALGHPALLRAAQDRQVTVGPMTRDELRAAIVEPALRAGVELEDGLVELLLADLTPTGVEPDRAEPGVLPLLSHALFATWHHDQGRRLTCQGYRRVGGVREAIASSASEAYDRLTPDQRRLARRLLLRLVHVGTDTGDTRRIVPLGELLAEFGPDAVEVERVLDRFITQRLITAQRDTVQLSHDALLAAWPALRGWLSSDRAGLVLRQQLATAAAAWRAEGGDPAALYRGTRLAAAQGWTAEHPDEQSALVREFLAASGRHARRHTRQLYQLVAALSALLLSSGLLAGYAFQQRATASQQRQTATMERNEAVSRLVAGQADWLRGRDVSLARQVALAAYQISPTVQARSSLLDAAATPTAARLGGTGGAIQAVAFSPDRRLLAAGGAEGRVRLWRASDPVPAPLGSVLTGPTGTVFAVAFSPRDALLAAGGADGRVYRWRLDDPAHPQALPPLAGPTSTVYALAFSPDGGTLAAGSADHRVWRWALNNAVPATTAGTGSNASQPLPALTGPDDAVQAVTFSPDGRLLAVGSADSTVRLWDLGNRTHPTRLAPLAGHTGKVLALAFSPNGDLLASGSGDQTVQMWSVADPQRPAKRGTALPAATSWINALAFSPDGATLATGTSDKRILLYDVATHRELRSLPQPTPVTALAFGADQHTLASAGTDGYVRYWGLPGPLLVGAGGAVFSAGFTPDGTILAEAGRDQTVRLWQVNDTRRPQPLGAPLSRPADQQGYSGTAALSPDGALLAAGGRDGAVDLWDIRRPARPKRIGPALTGATALIQTVAFSADGSLLAVAGDDSTTYLWRVSDPERPTLLATVAGTGSIVLSLAFHPRSPVLAVADTDGVVRLIDVHDPTRPAPASPPLRGLAGYAYSVAFSPDGGLLAVGSADKTLRLWQVSDPAHPMALPRPLRGPTSYVYWVSFHPSGSLITAASTDGTIWIWDISHLNRPIVVATLSHADQAYYVVAYRPDGHTLAAGSADGTVRLWETDPQRAAESICSTMGEPISRAEWEQYLSSIPYHPPC
ncbi:helix-turn-helix domain-containing protein [Micromonospora sp. WMMD723]|uniref:nSTAND1 domain-containing NTPase n=1 Tax=Micromonospora sp. WMMD723 TaxID=3403465 RepID=UPI003CF05780